MRTNNRHRTHSLIAIGALVLATAAATPTFGKARAAMTIRAVAVRGNEVAITVFNHTGRTQTGAVTSQVFMRGEQTAVMAPVTAAAGQTATIRIVMPAQVEDVLPLGVVVDDGVPF